MRYINISQNEAGIISSDDKKYDALITGKPETCIVVAMSSTDSKHHALLHIDERTAKDNILTLIRLLTVNKAAPTIKVISRSEQHLLDLISPAEDGIIFDKGRKIDLRIPAIHPQKTRYASIKNFLILHGHIISEQFLNYNPDEEYIALSKAGGIDIGTHQDFEISDFHNVNAVIARLRICQEERPLFLRYADNRYSNGLQKTTVANQRYIDRVLQVFNPNNIERDSIEIKAQITKDLDNNIITDNPEDKEVIQQEIEIHTTTLHYILTYSCYINANTIPSIQREFVKNPSEPAQYLHDTLSGPAIFPGLELLSFVDRHRNTQRESGLDIAYV